MHTTACQHRQVRLRNADSFIIHCHRMFLYDDLYQNIIVRLSFCELTERNNPSFVQFHIRIQSDQQCKSIGKTVSSINTAPHCGKIPKLHAHNMAQTFFAHILGIGNKTRMCLQLTQRHHTSDAKLIFRLLDRIQSQS